MGGQVSFCMAETILSYTALGINFRLPLAKAQRQWIGLWIYTTSIAVRL